jgi:hypothetical protein
MHDIAGLPDVQHIFFCEQTNAQHAPAVTRAAAARRLGVSTRVLPSTRNGERAQPWHGAFEVRHHTRCSRQLAPTSHSALVTDARWRASAQPCSCLSGALCLSAARAVSLQRCRRRATSSDRRGAGRVAKTALRPVIALRVECLRRRNAGAALPQACVLVHRLVARGVCAAAGRGAAGAVTTHSASCWGLLWRCAGGSCSSFRRSCPHGGRLQSLTVSRSLRTWWPRLLAWPRRRSSCTTTT